LFTADALLGRLMLLVPLVLSLTVHEWAHAWSAFKLGDDTAARQGRLTLNPLAHADPVGTVLLPLLGIPFGWAKPVPVSPLRFTRKISMRGGMMLTAAAGPLSNLVIALVCAVLFGLLYRFGLLELSSGEHVRDARQGLATLLLVTTRMNVALAVFNMLPIPPLDGSRVADFLMPNRWRSGWEIFVQYSGWILLGVIMFGRYILAGPMDWAMSLVDGLVRLVAGIG
jgi:Zn-dependent protease